MDILGYGTDAIDESSFLEGAAGQSVTNIPLQQIEVGLFQPRTSENVRADLIELQHSIEEHGVLQPILVRKVNNSSYQLIAGERRYQASRLASKKDIPAIIKELTEREAFTVAVVENIQRNQLSVLEEACAFKRLRDKYGYSSEQVAECVGKPRTTIANLIRLEENLCEQGKSMLGKGLVDYGHARALLTLSSKEQVKYLKKVSQMNLSVRQLEALLKRQDTEAKSQNSRFLQEKEKLQRIIKEATLEKSAVNITAKGKARVTMEFDSYKEAAEFFKNKVLW